MQRTTEDKQNQACGGKLFHFRPVLFLALFFAYGIFCAFLHKVKDLSWTALLAPIFAVCVLLLSKERKAFLLKFGALLLSFSLGTVALTVQTERYLSGEYVQGEQAFFATVAEREEDEKAVVLTLKNLRTMEECWDGKLYLLTEKSAVGDVQVGNEVYVKAYVYPVADKSVKNFLFGSVAEDMRYTALFVSQFSVTDKNSDFFSSIRKNMRDVLYGGMVETAASVCYALLTGRTYGVDDGLLDNFRAGGIAHLFAVSGLHIGALYAFCMMLMDKTALKKLPRAGRFCLVLATLLFYGGVCGFSPSVVRAVTVCMVLYAAKIVGVKSDGLERTGFAMFLVLALNPATLFTAGFLLSFAACYGIFCLGPRFRVLFRKLFAFLGEGGKGIASFLSVTLSAQLFTIPVSLFFFRYLSVWSLLLNCLFVPLVGGVFSVLLATTFVCCLLPSGISSFIMWFPGTLCSAVLFFFETLDFTFVLTNLRLKWTGNLLWYTLCALISGKICLKRAKIEAVEAEIGENGKTA